MTEIDRQNAFSGTRDVAERLRFNAERLEAYLREQIAGFAGPVAVSQFKGGQSNPTYLIETPLRRYALRRKPPGKLLPLNSGPGPWSWARVTFSTGRTAAAAPG